MTPDTPAAYAASQENKSPRISLVLPFHAKMKKKQELLALLSAQADQSEAELRVHFSDAEVAPLMKRLRLLLPDVQCPAEGKNIAIFVSKSAEKIYYFSPSRLEKYKLPVLVRRHNPKP